LASSFRDPHGALLATGNRIYRIVNAAGMADLDALSASAAAARWVGSGALIRTTMSGDADRRALLEDARVSELYRHIRGEAIFEHDRIPFPSFPYEWVPEMLHAAAMFTLDLALDLLPLAANRHFGLALDQLLFTRRDGLEPEEVYRWLRPLERVKPPFLSLVSMPVWLGSHHNQNDTSIYRKKVLPDPERAQFIVGTLLSGLKRKLRVLAPKSGVSSAWTGYMEIGNNYTAEHFAAKNRFVAECLSAHAPKRVLDVGCNTGHFSFMTARSGARVVAIDYDPAVAGAVWRQAAAGKLDVLPLVVNLTPPTPGVGWNNREWPSFLDRARGSFDAVFMLAVVHHMLVTERVPLSEIVALAAELTSDLLVIEFVSPQDSMFQSLVRGREELHRDLTQEVFENACRRHFQMVRVQHLEGTSRWLYLLRKLTPYPGTAPQTHRR
jgi:SAM-dependent methyltransferase